MTSRTTKVWFGLSVIGTISAGIANEAPAQHTPHAAPPRISTEKDTVVPATRLSPGQVLAAPQGGEAYLTDGGPKDTRIRIYRDIALMRGHLLVAAELIEAGLWDDAAPHVFHPAEELYGAMERYIKLHKVTPFDRQLKALAQTVKAKNKPAYLQARKVVDERITSALQSFKPFMADKPFTSYTARTIVEILKVAQAEYETSIDGDRFAKPVEYQDARGFVWHADALLDEHRREFEAIDKIRYAELRNILAEMKSAWPSAVPPSQPVIIPSSLAEYVTRFSAAAERFF